MSDIEQSARVLPWSPGKALDRVAENVRDHCRSKGFVQGDNWNPLAPRNSVAALAMAKSLVQSRCFDHYLAVAPEGHVYGYFFEQFGVNVLSVYVDYPPKQVDVLDDLSGIRGGRVLLIEDDVISGMSLRLVLAALEGLSPRTVALYLGREKDSQQLENVPAAIEAIYLAEDCLKAVEFENYEADFMAMFGG